MHRILISILLAGLFGFYCAPANASSYTDNGNGTVTDNTTGLIWQQCSDGLSTTTTKCDTGSSATLAWQAAISYCEGLYLGGFTDWRLPNIKDLNSIVDMTTSNPSINTAYFPATVSSVYWSSTTYAPGSAYAWFVNFFFGTTSNNDKATTYNVRCVRGQ